MAKGTTGFYLEGWKFSVYLAVPLFASWYFGDPQRQREAANYWQFVKYPANPNTGLKEQIEAMAAQKKAREEYAKQMKDLQTQAAKSRETIGEESKRSKGWLRWIGLGSKQ